MFHKQILVKESEMHSFSEFAIVDNKPESWFLHLSISKN